MSQKPNTAYPEQIFHTPFSAAYWRTAVSELKEPKMLVLAALFIALRMAIKGFKIPIADNMSVFFTFVVNALGSSALFPARSAIPFPLLLNPAARIIRRLCLSRDLVRSCMA